MSVPAFATGHVIQEGAHGNPVHVEVFFDVTCPFSGKMNAVLFGDAGVIATHPQVRFTFHHVPQPWHSQSTFAHEAVFAVRRLVPKTENARFVAFLVQLFARQTEFFDVNVWNSSRQDIHAKLCEIAKSAAGVDIAPLLAINEADKAKGMLNPGSYVTPDLKLACRYHRVRGVHVTPTVFVNGIEATAVSSGWSAEQWAAFLAPLQAAHEEQK